MFLQKQLAKAIDVLDIAYWQRQGLKKLGLTTIEDVLNSNEIKLMQIYYVGEIQLSAEEREELTWRSKSRTLPAGDVFKASLILALADGKSYSAVEAELNTSRPTIARWRARFEEARIEGLEGQHRGSRPRKATPSVQARILKKTQQKPTDGSSHWSCRKMAMAVGVSPATVRRIWAKARLKAPSTGSVDGQQRSGVRGKGGWNHRSRYIHFRCRSFPQADEIHSRLRQERQTLLLEVH